MRANGFPAIGEFAVPAAGRSDMMAPLNRIPNRVNNPEALSHQLIVIPRNQHSISRKSISEPALKVLYRLNKAGYQACLVGGAVRDLLLGVQPKDFDIATDATPEDLKRLFRNSRIIGRRFKIVHIRFGREIIEVTTFRAHHQSSQQISSGSTRHQIKGTSAPINMVR